jgi:UPF0755 protein
MRNAFSIREITRSKQFIFVVVSLVISGMLYLTFQLFVPFAGGGEGVEIEIRKGTSLSGALDMLKEHGFIRDKKLMIIIAKLAGVERKLKAGYYSFNEGSTPFSAFCALLQGRVVQQNLTIIEGETIWNAAERLEQAGVMDAETFFSLNADPVFLESLHIDAPSLEGYLFPDTYTFDKGTEPEKVLTVMVNTTRDNFTDDMRSQMEKMDMTEREVLALASIIEKEAVVDFERPIISAVYHNRLKKRMRLEADPTSIYGVKDFSEGVTRYDLKRNTPYNTYRRRGLPPGPIAAAGLKSIIAALYPADVPYLFFVSKNNGEHYFSSTVREHFNAVRRYRSEKYRLQRANNNG